VPLLPERPRTRPVRRPLRHGLPAGYADPYDADMPEWAADGQQRPERFAGLGPGPWPVCTSYQPPRRRSDAGISRATRDMELLFDLGQETR
jgi:hypothetical protein